MRAWHNHRGYSLTELKYFQFYLFFVACNDQGKMPFFFLVLFSTLEGDRETLLRVMGKNPYLLDSLTLLSFRGSGSVHAPPSPLQLLESLHVVLGGEG